MGIITILVFLLSSLLMLPFASNTSFLHTTNTIINSHTTYSSPSIETYKNKAETKAQSYLQGAITYIQNLLPSIPCISPFAGMICFHANGSVVISNYPNAPLPGFIANIHAVEKLVKGKNKDTAYAGSKIVSYFEDAAALHSGLMPISYTPLTSSIEQFNRDNAGYLLTCPNKPNSANIIEYFTTDPSRIYGDRCLEDSPFAFTAIWAYAISYVIPFWIPFADRARVTTIIKTGILGPVWNAKVTNLGFSGELNYSGKRSISANYNTKSYIFQTPKASSQKALWSWGAQHIYLTKSKPLTFKYGTKLHFFTLGIPTNPKSLITFCNYHYNFNFHATVTFRNTQIPIPTKLNSNNKATSYGGVSLLPYLFYTFNIPTLSSSLSKGSIFLNMTYNLYSPINWNTPNTLDPFSLYTGSGLLSNYKHDNKYSLAMFPLNSIAFSSPYLSGFNEPNALFTLVDKNKKLSQEDFEQNSGKPISISNPSFISITPNDKIYVLNYFSKSSLIAKSQNTYMYELSLLPKGYYNLSNLNLPTSQKVLGGYNYPSSASNKNNWINSWHKYWKAALEELSSNKYITNLFELSNSKSSFWGIFHSRNGKAILNDIIPTGVTTDYQNDLFIVGLIPINAFESGFNRLKCFSLHLFSRSSSSCSKNFVISVLPPGKLKRPKGAFQKIISPLLPTEIAASPNGKYIYLASPNSGNILVLAYNKKSTGNSFKKAGTINLAYNKLNINKYLSHGGPFGNTIIANAYKSQKVYLDKAKYHHPLALADYDGLLYVLDNWTSDAGGGTSILMLRTFSYNRTEIPIDPSHFNNLNQNSHTSDFYTTKYYPPYGWPLSANISLPGTSRYQYRSLSDSHPEKSLSFCIAGCDATPNTLSLSHTFGYPPIGPRINSYGDMKGLSHNLGFTVDFNNTAYLLAHVQGKNKYTELLELRMNIQNYTKLSFGSNSTYKCFISNSQSGNNCVQKVKNLKNLYPPLEGVPSSFAFGINQGSPQRFLNLPNAFSTEFPLGLTSKIHNGFKKPSQTIIKNGISKTANYKTATSAENNGKKLSFSTKIPQTYINSIIHGYFVFPYTVEVNRQTTYEGGVLSWFMGLFTGGGGEAIAHNLINKQAGVCLPIFLANTRSDTTYYELKKSGTVSLYPKMKIYSKISSNLVNTTINGGPSYTLFNLTHNLYIANISDKNLILYPNIATTTLTNRQFGEFYANLSVTKWGTLPIPLVINASSFYAYKPNQFFQVSFLMGGTGLSSIVQVHPAFVQESEVTNNKTNVCYKCFLIQNMPSLLKNYLPKNWESYIPHNLPEYYYNPLPSLAFKLIGGKSKLSSYIGTTTRGLTVFQLFKHFDHYIGVDLNLLNNSNYLTSSPAVHNAAKQVFGSYTSTLGSYTGLSGYNRIIYTYVDAFNNTIFMPLDVDLANLTTISLHSTTSVNPKNPNETTIHIKGTAGSYSGIFGGYYPLPKYSLIFLYYGANINYFNATNTPTKDPKGYFSYAERCAFANSIRGCQLANPFAILTQGKNKNTAYLKESLIPTYYPSYGIPFNQLTNIHNLNSLLTKLNPLLLPLNTIKQQLLNYLKYKHTTNIDSQINTLLTKTKHSINLLTSLKANLQQQLTKLTPQQPPLKLTPQQPPLKGLQTKLTNINNHLTSIINTLTSINNKLTQINSLLTTVNQLRKLNKSNRFILLKALKNQILTKLKQTLTSKIRGQLQQQLNNVSNQLMASNQLQQLNKIFPIFYLLDQLTNFNQLQHLNSQTLLNNLKQHQKSKLTNLMNYLTQQKLTNLKNQLEFKSPQLQQLNKIFPIFYLINRLTTLHQLTTLNIHNLLNSLKQHQLSQIHTLISFLKGQIENKISSNIPQNIKTQLQQKLNDLNTLSTLLNHLNNILPLLTNLNNLNILQHHLLNRLKQKLTSKVRSEIMSKLSQITSQHKTLILDLQKSITIFSLIHTGNLLNSLTNLKNNLLQKITALPGNLKGLLNTQITRILKPLTNLKNLFTGTFSNVIHIYKDTEALITPLSALISDFKNFLNPPTNLVTKVQGIVHSAINLFKGLRSLLHLVKTTISDVSQIFSSMNTLIPKLKANLTTSINNISSILLSLKSKSAQLPTHLLHQLEGTINTDLTSSTLLTQIGKLYADLTKLTSSSTSTSQSTSNINSLIQQLTHLLNNQVSPLTTSITTLKSTLQQKLQKYESNSKYKDLTYQLKKQITNSKNLINLLHILKGNINQEITKLTNQITPQQPPLKLTPQQLPALNGLNNQLTNLNKILGSSCIAQPKSLLQITTKANCNIYGNYNLPATRKLGIIQEYCYPTALNGNGILTSQLGLIGVVFTNSTGGFSDNVVACGTGKVKIIAKSFGGPIGLPEPSKILQPSLINSVAFNGSNPNIKTDTYEYTYAFSPNETAESVTIGSYLLSFGYINIIVIAGIAIVIGFVLVKKTIFASS